MSTVSHTLSGNRKVRSETARRVLRAVSELGYRPSSLAQAMITGRSNTLGLIIPDIVNPFFPHVARGAEDAAHEDGYSLVLCNTDLRPERELEYVETLVARSVDGILFMPGDPKAGQALMRLYATGVPFVLMDESLAGPSGPGVYSDNEAGSFAAGQHLLATGRRRIVFLGGPKGLPTVQEKLGGLRGALESEGLTPVACRFALYRAEAGYEMMADVLASGVEFDGVFAADDLLALGAMQALSAAGRRIPDDVGVCGFDGIPGSELWTPSLTTVAQQIYELGATAARLLVRYLAGEIAAIPRVVLPAELIVRASTAPAIVSSGAT